MLTVIRVGKKPSVAGNRYITSAIVSLEENRTPNEPAFASNCDGASFAECLEKLNGPSRSDSTLLIFDQFEEILTTDPLDREAKTEFFNQLGEVLRDPRRWALFAIREDYVAALDPYLRALPTRLKSTFRLDLLTTDCARNAIQQPAREFGSEFTEEATTRLVDDLRQVWVQAPDGTAEQQLGPYVEPVQLQVVCFRLWEKPRRDLTKITVDEVAATGDVDSALAEFYSERVQQVAQNSGVSERAIREWFDRALITEAGIRSEVMKGPESNGGRTEVAIQELQSTHLVRREERRGVTWLELSHDRLVRPIRADNAKWFAAHLSLLQQQATLWQRQNRSDLICLRGEALTAAEQWVAAHPGETSQTEKEFLNRSRELVAAEEHARTTRRLRRWTIVLTLFIAITLAMALAAWHEAKIASARGLAAHAQRLLNDRLGLAMLLSYEAQRKADLPETRGTLLTAALTNPRLLAFLHGHQSTIGALAFSPDGKLLAAGDYKNRVVLWNVQTHRPERVLTFDTFKDVVRSIAFSPDGQYMAASSKDGSIVLRDNKTEKIFPFPKENGHSDNIWSVAFSPDSKSLVSGASDRKIILWDVPGGTPHLINEGKSQVRSVAFNANGTLIAAGCGNGNVLIWQNQNGAWLLFDSFAAHDATDEKQPPSIQVTAVAFSPKDESLLAIGSKDWTVSLRDVVAKQFIARGKHRDALTSLAFSPDGNAVLTASQDGTLRLWAVPKKRPASPTDVSSSTAARVATLESIGAPFAGHVGWVLASAFSPDGRTVASGGIDREAILWDTQYFPPENPNADQTQQDLFMALSPDGRYEVSNNQNGAIVSHDRKTGATTTLAAHTNPITNVCFSREGRYLISSSSAHGDVESGKIVVNDFAVPDKPPVTLEIQRKISFAAISADGKLAAIALKGAEIMLWDLVAQKQIGPSLQGHDDAWNYAVAFSPDGKKIAAGGDNQYARIWELNSNKESIKLAEHNGSVRAIALVRTEKLLLQGAAIIPFFFGTLRPANNLHRR